MSKLRNGKQMINLWLKPDEIKALDDLAAEYKISRTELIKEILGQTVPIIQRSTKRWAMRRNTLKAQHDEFIGWFSR